MSVSALLASATHPSELYALVKFLLDSPSSSTTAATTTSSPTVKPSTSHPASKPTSSQQLTPSRIRCNEFLALTSRSFVRVIAKLDPELSHPVCIFYLVLRALDTVEDDMSLDLALKKEMLVDFHRYVGQKGWRFEGSGEGEKDRQLLVEFDVVVKEFLTLDKRYQAVITDITKRMGAGMATYLTNPTPSHPHHIEIQTTESYNTYTHYVAGLVGIGLTDLFTASGLETLTAPEAKTTHLANEMGQFLQKTNILKDFREDLLDGRVFWPRDVWQKYAGEGRGVERLLEVDNQDNALACLNELVADALKLVPSCLDYMAMLRNPTVFQFCAIPQMMAIATLDHFYNSPAVFRTSGTKIRRGLAAKLMLASTDMRSVKRMYLHYALDINRRNAAAVGKNDRDKSFLPVAIACADIVRWIHAHDAAFPATATTSASGNWPFDWVVVAGLFVIATALAMGMLPMVL
ncbi:Farnesyl-diphosphate farnesyltransferase [Thoreauomyces humboldtii]|nr:Farnesyl-diphosphate farnesyltransferase [Thoreauomyces humboldtii]